MKQPNLDKEIFSKKPKLCYLNMLTKLGAFVKELQATY